MAQTINKKILAIIPARGGSKGIPKKNVRLLVGKPLIIHTIDSALKSKYLDRIVVSTDDKDISNISKQAGVQIIQRPKELAGDTSLIYLAVGHAINYLKKVEKYKPDIILLLQPTSPLRTTKDIDSALELFLKNKCDSVVSICESEHSVYDSFKLSKKYLKPIFGKKYLGKRRQDFPKSYIINGAIYVSTSANLLKYKNFYSGRVLPYIMPKEKSIDIDEEVDFKLTEILIKELCK